MRQSLLALLASLPLVVALAPPAPTPTAPTVDEVGEGPLEPGADVAAAAPAGAAGAVPAGAAVPEDPAVAADEAEAEAEAQATAAVDELRAELEDLDELLAEHEERVAELEDELDDMRAAAELRAESRVARLETYDNTLDRLDVAMRALAEGDGDVDALLAAAASDLALAGDDAEALAGGLEADRADAATEALRSAAAALERGDLYGARWALLSAWWRVNAAQNLALEHPAPANP